MKKMIRLYLFVVFISWFLSPLAATVYFVDSQNGSDTSSGLSETLAWQSLTKVNNASLKAGDIVKFARGGVWRGSLKPKSGASGNPITYTSFGFESLPKPRIYGSLPLNAPSDWENAGINLWRTVEPVTKENTGTLADVGNLIFDGKSAGHKCWSEDQLIKDDYFWFETDTRKVWLYSAANPAEKFNEIEAALRSANVVSLGNVSNVIFSGLDVRYGAAHGFGGGNSAFITIRDCDISWVGGGVQHINTNGNPVRFGNGVEFWEAAHDNIVEGCRIWEIYDAAVTNQGSTANTQRNITYRNNIIWNSEYSFEYWNRPAESISDNIVFTQNMCYNAGYGWGHAQRPDMRNGRHIMVWGNTSATTGAVITGNVFAYASESIWWDSATSAAGKDWKKNLTMNNNIWMQQSGTSRLFMVDGLDGYKNINPASLSNIVLPYEHISVYQWQISGSGEKQIDLNGKTADIKWTSQYADEFEKFSANTASVQNLSSQGLVLVENLLTDPQLPSVGHVIPFNQTLQTSWAINAGVQPEDAQNGDKAISSLQYLGKASVTYWTWDVIENKRIVSSQLAVYVYRAVENPIVHETTITAQPSGTTVDEGNTCTLTVTATYATSYQWQKWDGTAWSDISGATNVGYTIHSATPSDAGNYRVVVGGDHNAVTSAVATVKVNEATVNIPETAINIPGIFTPNGDGYNDTWEIPGIGRYPDVTISIYNRAKKLMVELKGSQLPWDGRGRNGNLLESGYYLYQIRLGKDSDTMSGYVTILR